MYLVKNSETGLFLGHTGWTPNSSQAYQFPNGLSIVLHFQHLFRPFPEDKLEIIKVGGKIK